MMGRKSKSDCLKSAPEIRAEMQIKYGVNVSSSMARRRVREAGLNGYKSRQKPRLTCHKKARLQFARSHKDWSARM